MRAIILAAGYGTRLWPLTVDRTKPAIPFLGKPLVGYVAEYLGRYGCKNVVVNLHHRPESVRAALGDGSRFGVHLEYVEEETILGTSGAMDNARHLLDGETFFAVNGKIVTDIDLTKALETHRRMDALATLVLLPNARRERFSIVETRDGLVTGFGGMPAPLSDGEQDDERDVPLMFTGIQILEPRIFDYIPRGVFSHSVTDVYPQAIAQDERIVAHIASGRWYELSTIPRYLDISLALLRDTGRDVFAGEGCHISSGAEVRESILWDNVRVEDKARVRRTVLGDGVVIRSGESVENAAVVRAELVRGSEPPPKALHGEFRGENFVVSLSQ
ncbi:MAG: mannose-phosphate guanylyltransferase / phosphomannomutase [Acidobacteriota bacterium]|jgi:NDP-sugar pyrophosphorylase family protein|nr:mannose-phosphate guanylyltransferase / phosphomannomutase [Acidobacteriota bacterium]